MKLKRKTLHTVTVIVVILAMVLGIGIWGGVSLAASQDSGAKVITVSTLSKIIEISDLSTYRTRYNGVVAAVNEKNPDKIDYYVTYQSTVEAGIDFTKADIVVDKGNKTVVITLPEVTITNTAVDPATLEYIFVNKKAETPTVSEQAIKLCEADVAQETSSQDGILELARQNARNVVEALTQPLIAQSAPDYTLTIQ